MKRFRAHIGRVGLWWVLAASAAGCGSLEIGIEYTPLKQDKTAAASEIPTSEPTVEPEGSPSPAPSETEIAAPGLQPSGETASGDPILRLTQIEGIEPISWIDAQNLALADDERGGYFSLPVSPGSTAAARFEPPSDMLPSPDGTLILRCGAGLEILRLGDGVTVGTSDLAVAGGCPASRPSYGEGDALAYLAPPAALAWEPNGRSLAFVAEDGGLYLWPSDGSSARKVDVAPAEFPLVSWSPIGTALAFVRAYDSTSGRVTLSAINSAQGQLWEEDFSLEGNPDTVSIAWIGYQAILARSSNAWSVLDAHTGRRLTYWTADTRARWFQMPNASPDGRWLAIEVTRPGETSGEYKVVDLRTRGAVPLGRTSGNYIEFVAWKADSSLMYLVSYPANQFSVSDPKTPFGLLAVDPRAKSVVEVFGGALAATLSPDKRWALVTLPDRSGGALRMTAALWELGSMATAWRRVIADEMIYSDRLWSDGTALGTRPFAQAAWSHDGSRVIFEDHQGSLYIGGLDGTIELTAAGFVTPWVERTSADPLRFSWSPDDRFVLVEVEGDAWILSSSP